MKNDSSPTLWKNGGRLARLGTGILCGYAACGLVELWCRGCRRDRSRATADIYSWHVNNYVRTCQQLRPNVPWLQWDYVNNYVRTSCSQVAVVVVSRFAAWL